MVFAGLALFAFSGALWLTYMLRYPQQWDRAIDRLHLRWTKYGLPVSWMQRLEKGPVLTVLVAMAVLIILTDLAVLWSHPTALTDFWHAHHLDSR